MIRKLILAITLFSIQIAYSQKAKDTLSEPIGYFSFSAGPSMQLDNPVDRIGSKDSNLRMGPNALGMNLRALLNFRIKDPFWLAIQIQNQRYGMNESAALFALRELYSVYNWSMVSTSFRLTSFQLGFTYVIPAGSKKWSTYLKLMGGVGNVLTPQISAEGQCKDSTVVIIFAQEKFRTSSFLGGLGLRYNLTDFFGFTFDADYQYCVFGSKLVDGSTHSGFKKTPALSFPGGLRSVNLHFGISLIMR